MKLIRTLAAFAAIGLSMLTAHAQFQVVHDAPNTTSTPKLTPLILADGSLITFHQESGNDIFRKYDANGVLIWNKALAGNSQTMWNGDPAIALMIDGADGFQFARLAGISVTYIDSLFFFEQQVVDSIEVVHVNGNGEVTSAIALKKVFMDDGFFGGYYLNEFDATRTPDNGIVLVLTSSYGPGGTVEIVKIDAAGFLVWSRSVGNDIGFGGPNPTIAFDSEPSANVAVSPTGRIYYLEGSTYPYSNLRLTELDTNGDMLWMRRYVYGNTNPFITFDDIQTDNAGNVHAAGRMTSTVGNFHYFLRTDPDGVLNSGDLYRTPMGIQIGGSFAIDAEGRRFHLANTFDLSTSIGSQGLLIADTLGSPAQFIRRDDQVVLPNNVFIVPQGMDVAGDRYAISGSLEHEHVDLAYTTRYETVASITTGSMYNCLMDDTTFAHIPIPLNIMTTEDVTNAASIDISAYYSSEPLVVSFTSVASDPLEPLCTFAGQLLQINLGVDDAMSNSLAPLMLNSLVSQGTPLLVNDPQAELVDVYDSYGALVQHSTLGTGRSISTTGWSSGVYLVRAINSGGTPFRTQRVVVQ